MSSSPCTRRCSARACRSRTRSRSSSSSGARGREKPAPSTRRAMRRSSTQPELFSVLTRRGARRPSRADCGKPAVCERTTSCSARVNPPTRYTSSRDGQRAHHGRGLAGHRMPLAELAAPDYFGEMGLLTGQPRRATVVATRGCRCAIDLSKSAFDAVAQGASGDRRGAGPRAGAPPGRKRRHAEGARCGCAVATGARRCDGDRAPHPPVLRASSAVSTPAQA